MKSLWFGHYDSKGLRVKGSGFRDWSLGFRVQGKGCLGIRV